MRVLAIVHQRDAGLGVFADSLAAADAAVEEWVPSEREAPAGSASDYDAAIVLGGAMHADQLDAHPWLVPEKQVLRQLLDARIPVLGVCLGAQLLAEATGGETRRAALPEIGWFRVEVCPDGHSDPLLDGLEGFEAFQWHSYECVPPSGSAILARNDLCAQAFRVGESAWGIQFHAEVSAAIVNRWIDEYHTDPDALRIGIEPGPLHTETAEKLDRWNDIGRGICRRFLEAADGG